MAQRKNTKRALESEAKKKQIRDVALQLFEENGFEQTTIGEISEKSGMSVGSIYHYFGSKDGILNYYLHDIDTICFISGDHDELLSHPLETIMGCLMAYARYWEEVGADLLIHMMPLFSQAYDQSPGVFPPTLKGYKELNAFIAECQERGVIEQDLSSDNITEYLLTIGRSIVHDWGHYGGQFSLTERISSYMPRIVSTFIKQ